MTPSTNVNKVPMKQWRRWSPRAKHVFNTTYDFLSNNPDLASHPKAPRVLPEHWSTTCWNAAWTAADAADDVPLGTYTEDINMRTGTIKTTLPRSERRAP